MRTSFGIALLVALFVVTSGAWAGTVPITVPNYSFEIGPGGLACPTPGSSCNPASWTQTGSAAEWQPTAGRFSSIPDGVQVGWVNANGDLSQVLTNTIAANTVYTLTVDVSFQNFSGVTFGPIVDLEAFSAVAGSTVLASATAASPGAGNTTPTAGNWSLWTLTFNSASDPAVVGEQLEIALGSTTNQTSYDDVGLNQTVPEPAMFALVGAGLLGLVTRRRFAK